MLFAGLRAGAQGRHGARRLSDLAPCGLKHRPGAPVPNGRASSMRRSARAIASTTLASSAVSVNLAPEHRASTGPVRRSTFCSSHTNSPSQDQTVLLDISARAAGTAHLRTYLLLAASVQRNSGRRSLAAYHTPPAFTRYTGSHEVLDRWQRLNRSAFSWNRNCAISKVS